MNKLWIFSVFIVLTELGMAGCQPETNFRAYKDQKNKGEQIFLIKVVNVVKEAKVLVSD
jgi:hypothetical protein